MTEPRIKICGLTRESDAQAAIEAGATYLGFVFAPSPRQVTAHEIRPWLEALRPHAELVGVFRDQTLEFVEDTLEELDLDLVQLHGAEEGSAWMKLPVRSLVARAVAGGSLGPERFGGAAWAEVLDSASAQGGGSGQSFDWSLAVGRARDRRVFLAGGLDASNVATAIELVQPFAVDVSSGVEGKPGLKDHGKLREFCAAVLRK